MNDEDLYDYSTRVNNILLAAKNLLGLNLLRFKHLVDNSEKGFDCAYAQISRRHFLSDRATELSTLKALAKQINTLIEDLESETTWEN